MLTNSPASKLKASKSSRDLDQLRDTESDSFRRIKIFEKGDGDQDSNLYYSNYRNNSVTTKIYLSRERTDVKLKSRPRSTRDDIQMPQGSTPERRGQNVRGRGGGFTRKMERENDGLQGRGKHQELQIKGSASDLTLSKYYNDMESNKSRLDHTYNVPEDSRISKLLRRLSREEDPEKFLTLCQQLQDSLMSPDNSRYIRRAFDDITNSMLTALHRAPGSESKIQISKCLGGVGYVLIDQDFKRYMDWVFKQYEAEKNEVRVLLLGAMQETVRLDKESPSLKDAAAIMANLQTALEACDLPEVIMATVEVIVTLTDCYPATFTKHFRDTVDILVGWHIDGSQSEKVLYYASRSVQKLTRYWIGDIPFSTNLLGQFLEDMEAYGEDYNQASSGRSTPAEGEIPTAESTVIKVTALIKVFNTVAKSLGIHLNPITSPQVSLSFLTECLAKMLRTVIKTLELITDEDLVVSANECSYLLLTHIQSKTSPGHQLLYNLIDLQLNSYSLFGDETLLSMLRIIVKIIREVSGNLSMDFVKSLLAPESPILVLRFSPSVAIQNEVLSIYHGLLNLKNIPLLQEAYRHVLGDLNIAYRMIVPSVKELCQTNPYSGRIYNSTDAEVVVLFYFRALTDLANATNSIIGMWALNPSILELLATDLQPSNKQLSQVLQYSLLYLLHSHCSKSNNFVSSSKFVSTGQDRANVCDMFGLPSNLGPEARSVSPTSGHYAIILGLLAQLLSSDTAEEIQILVLTWSREVFLHSEPFFNILYSTKEMDHLINLVVSAGHSTSKSVVSRVGDNIEQLLSMNNIPWKSCLLSAIVDVCMFHVNSSSQPIHNQMCRLLTMIPWDVTIPLVEKVVAMTSIGKSHSHLVNMLSTVSRYHIARDSCGPMQAQHFRTFMGYLLQGNNNNGDWLYELFCSCWPLQATEEKKNVIFGNLARTSSTVLFLWATWEAAQLCIMMKLRTPLGKPQDTFTSIEGAIKKLAREIGQEERKVEKRSAVTQVSEVDRVRHLLEFVEHLEKAMYNAAEGCAMAMTQPPKPIRTFFHTNKSTCGEWLTRIRMAVVAVSIRAGQATTTVRHGHCLLQGLVEANMTQGLEFELATMYVCWAYCKLKESASILGLFAWCRDVSGRKFVWLKPSALQAAGKYELAAEDYRKILELKSPRSSPILNADEIGCQRLTKSDIDPQIIGFIADQLTECYKYLQNWSELYKWKLKRTELWSNQNGSTPMKYMLNGVTVDYAKALQEYDDNDLNAACELMKWPTEKELPDVTKCWNSYRLVTQTECTLTSIAMQLATGKSDRVEAVKFTEMLGMCSKVTKSFLQGGIENSPSEFLQDAMVLQYAVLGLENFINGKMDKDVFDKLNSSTTVNMSLLTRVLWWGKYFDKICNKTSSQLQLEVAKVARKEGNLGLAQKLLLKYLETEEKISIKRKSTLVDVASNILSMNIVEGSAEVLWHISKAKAYTEMSKLLYALGNNDKAIDVCAYAALGVSQSLDENDSGMKERSSRLLMTLSKWLIEKRRTGGEALVENWHFMKLIDQEKGRNNLMSYNTAEGPISIPPAEVAIEYILQLSTSCCPDLAKTWSSYATWCYLLGKKMVESPLSSHQLSDIDKAAIYQLMPRGATLQEFETVTSILSRTRSFSHEEDIDGEDINTSEMIKSQLLTVWPLNGVDNDHLDALVGVWLNAQKRVYSYYQQAATAFFKYLMFCADSGNNDCNTIMATLRLLRMIVKHAMELQDVLETGLSTTPTRPWKEIIPQLFSRLSHPEPYVRTRVSELLCRVAEDAPHLITFPAVVGAAAGGARLREISSVSASRIFRPALSQADDEEDEDDEEDDEDEGLNNDEDVCVLKNCFLAMVDTLSKQAPIAISQVQLVVSELHRITLLWDELWLGTLVQHHAEIARRLSQLESEVNRVDDNSSLSPAEKDILLAEKHRIIMKPLVFILEQLHAITSVPPETPHEVWFQEKFSDYITSALQKLKSPLNPRKPHDSWHPLKILQSRLQHRTQKRGAYTLHMSSVSPALAALKDTVIAMPGVTPSPGKIITIASVNNNITILPTKTKPKKLVFHGNDGQMYTYLFKGLEDLHLDERIMQFLSIANTMLSSEHHSNSAMYHARHYSVIPLGPRSGLISWVDGVTPLFGLYKRWQQREIAAGSLKVSGSSNNHGSGGGQQVMRPSEMFYTKLTPLLKEKGITNLDNRKEWPLPILRQVLTELMDETPKDLLAKELWCHSLNAGGWWKSTRTYSYSVAVMSIIGYIIGLGDRHLDNVLVDLNTGEVVHIDYNVCFEKGKTLRVPEKVPFRMTQNIRAALGVTGVEGIFRLTCEHVLKVMKKGRETLLTLLEAFVYDPLIDWTPDNETGYAGAVYGGGRAVATETKQSRKELEHEVTRAMFCVRITEIKSDWFNNRDEMLEAVPLMETEFRKWLDVLATIKSSEEDLQDCHQQMALVKEAEAQGPTSQHQLYTLANRFNKHRRTQDAIDKLRLALTERLEDSEKLLVQHSAAYALVRGPQLAMWIAEVNYPVKKDSHMVFDLVKEFLQNAGQSQMVAQCEQSESELGQMEQQQILLIRSCLDMLTKYKAVTGLYPASYINTHRAACYRRWCMHLLNNTTLEGCNDVKAQFGALFSPEPHSTLLMNQQILSCSYQQQGVINEANIRLQKWFERLTMEGLPDGTHRVDTAYLEARAAMAAFPSSEKGAVLALECVNVTALCALNKRYMMMESAAFCAGESLVDLTSREGDWFLDEMYVVSTSMTELASHIPSQHPGLVNTGSDTRVQLVLQCIQSAHGIYKGLQELNFNFHTIILPEAIERIQAEEPTVLAMVANLNDTISSVGTPLQELLVQLEKHRDCLVMEMESPHGSAQLTVATLRSRFKELTRPLDSGSEDRPGMMLLMGFNGLFEKLQKDGTALVAALETLKTPISWKKIDQVRDSRHISAPVFNDATRGVLEDIFLIKRLLTMQEFFGLCCQMALNSTIVHDDDRLMKPVRRYSADYVRGRLLGVTSQTLATALCLLLQRIGLNVSVEIEQRDVGADGKVPLEELCRKAVDMCLKLGLFSSSVLAQASGLTSSLESTWRRKENARRLQQEVEARRSTLKRLHYQLTAYHWLHEDSLMMQGAAMNSMVLINRPSFMLELRQTFSTLLSLQPRIVEAQKQQNALVMSVEQRLKWAAGVNPALTEVLAAFDSTLASRTERLNKEQRLAIDIGHTCNILLHHEALRTRTSEGVANDNAFLLLLDQCEKSCVLISGYDQSITPLEESLVQLLPPENSVDQKWIHSIERLISGSVKSLQHKIVGLQELLLLAQGAIKSKAINIHGLMNTHHKLMADVKNLIKAMLKYEDADLSSLPDYWTKYRAYSEQFSTLIRQFAVDDVDVDMNTVHRALEQLNQLQGSTGIIYKELLNYGKPANTVEEGARKRPPLLRQESVCMSPRRGVPSPSIEVKKTSRDPHTGKAMQERNAYAMGVWRRVKTKFEGKDPDLGRKVSTPEQVDYVIREATNLDNLSLLYEGWTPWV